MKKTFLLAALTLIAAPYSPLLFGYGNGNILRVPLPATARVDDKEQIHIRYFSSTPLTWQETTSLKKDDKGEEKPVVIKFAYQAVEEHTLSLPLKAVKAFDTEGKPLDVKQLAEMLAKDGPVILHDCNPDPKLFAAFKKEIPVIFLSVPLDPNAPAAVKPVAPPKKEEPKPVEPKPEEPKKEPKKDPEK